MAGYNNSITDINSKVGIGTGQTEPASKLEINGVTLSRGGTFSTPTDTRTDVGLVIAENDFIYTLDGSDDYLRRLIGKTSDIIQIGEPGTSLIDGINLKPGTTGGYVQIFDNASVTAKFVDGKLGLGSTDPLAPLHVVTPAVSGIDLNNISKTASNLVRFTNPQYSTSATMGLLLRVFPDSDARQGAGLIMTGGSDNAASNLSLFVSKDDGTGSNISQSYSALHIAGNTGRVGIGTTSPGAYLQIGDYPSNNINITTYPNVPSEHMIHLTAPETTNYYGGGISFGENAFTAANITVQDAGGNGSLHMLFGTRDTSGIVQERMRLTSEGDIGIDSTDPTARLHIRKTTTWGEMSNPIINIQNNGTGGNINTAHNMGSITWKSGTVSTAEIKAVRNTPASGDNVELRFSTSDAGVQGERMTIENDGVVLINNSLGINVTSISTGYKLDIGGGDIYVRQAVAKISLGQFGSQGDAHFGASGIGVPTVGSQDYGFYSAHNAYRTSTGAWKHSRTSTIGAVRILGGGGGSSGNAGFSFDYSANNGTSDISWTNLMHLSTGGTLQLPSYNAGVLKSDGNGTITSGGDITIDGECIINDNFVNYEFDPLDNVAIQYWLLCFNSGNNDVNGTLIGDRSSGHHQAMNLDVVISAKSASMQTGMLTSKQVLESNEKYSLVTLTYASNNYVAIKYDGHPYPVTGVGYFTGFLRSTIGTSFLLAVNGASVSNVAAFSNANTKATIQAAKVGIGTTDPDEELTVNGITRAVDQIFFGAINTDNVTYGPYIESFDDKGLKFDYNGNNGGEFQVWNHDQNGGGAFQAFNIDQGGNVGINITSGSDKLTLKGAFSLYDTSAVSAIIRLNPNGDSYINGGDLGVGVTLPQHKLDVGGTIRSYNYTLAGNTTNPTTTAATIYDQASVGLTLSAHNIELRNYNGSSMVRSVFFQHNSATFTGTCTATNFILSSDKTLKENIKDIDNNHIDVSWKNFELKSEPGVKRSGVIAQELETKHPEFVRTDKEGLKSVAYVDLLIAKIAELEARLEKAGI